jgi:hypothetical protein
VQAQLWLCETYPLSLQEQVLPIVDLLAISNSHFQAHTRPALLLLNFPSFMSHIFVIFLFLAFLNFASSHVLFFARPALFKEFHELLFPFRFFFSFITGTLR